MKEPEQLEEKFKLYIENLPNFAPDGILEIDNQILEELEFTQSKDIQEEDPFSNSFYIIESEDKLTLFNEKYLVWIVPQLKEGNARTFTLIAPNTPNLEPLELVFTTSGIYNQSSLVLQLLERYLEQISENERMMSKLKES